MGAFLGAPAVAPSSLVLQADRVEMGRRRADQSFPSVDDVGPVELPGWGVVGRASFKMSWNAGSSTRKREKSGDVLGDHLDTFGTVAGAPC